MLLIDFNFKHGIRKGFDDFTFYFDLVLFWHRFLSLTGKYALFFRFDGYPTPKCNIFVSFTQKERGKWDFPSPLRDHSPHILLNMAAVTRSASDTLNNYDDCKGYKMAAVVTAATNYEL